MIVADAEIILAIYFQNPGWEGLHKRLMADPDRSIGVLSVLECQISIRRRHRAGDEYAADRVLSEIETLLNKLGVTINGDDPGDMKYAADADDRYGTGRHPAALNLGDCLVYAACRRLGARLLTTNPKFQNTDLALA